MEYTIDIMGKIHCVRGAENVDAANATELKGMVDVIVAGSRAEVILDLSSTQFMDSSGVGAVMFLFKNVSQHEGRMVIAGASGQPQALLDNLHFRRVVPIYDDVDEAVASFN